MLGVYSAISLAAAGVAAHTTGVSQSDFVVADDGTVDAEMVFAVGEIAGAVAIDMNHDGAVTPEELTAARPDLERLVLDGVEVKADGRACAGGFRGAELAEADGLTIRARYACPRRARSLTITMFLLSELRPEHRHVARIRDGALSSQRLLGPADRSLTMDLDPSRAASATTAGGWRRTVALIVTAAWTVGMVAFFIVRWRQGKRRAKSVTPK